MAKLTTNQFPCLDSFESKKFLPEGQEEQRKIIIAFDGKECKAVVTHKKMTLKTAPQETIIYFDRGELLKSGAQRLYFLCPYCAERVRKLYFRKGFKCRQCAGLIYPQQKVNKLDMPLYQIAKLYKKLDPTTEYDMYEVRKTEVPPRPEGMSFQEYIRIRNAITQKLEEYVNNFMRR